MDKTIIFIIIGVVLVGGLFWAWQTGVFVKTKIEPTPLPEGIVLFYGADCPHCKNVEDYISQNKIEEKVKITKLEIQFNNKTSPELLSNQSLLIKTAQDCKLDIGNGISIPFLYDGRGNCLLGDGPVINFLKNEAGIK